VSGAGGSDHGRLVGPRTLLAELDGPAVLTPETVAEPGCVLVVASAAFLHREANPGLLAEYQAVVREDK
jgi:hypothetical protein